MNRLLAIQVAIMAACALALAELAINFPYPSPLIETLLPAKLRWPTQQVEGWVEAGDFPSSFLTHFARDPERAIPPGENLVAPADGVVQNSFAKDGTSYLVIGMSFWDVHVIRAPAAGVVTGIEEEGLRLVRHPNPEQVINDILERGKDAPVQKIITFRTKFGELKVRMITSYWASRLKVWVYRGEQVQKGDRIGRILLGSTTVLEAPDEVMFSVKPRSHVTGGQSIVYGGGGER